MRGCRMILMVRKDKKQKEYISYFICGPLEGKGYTHAQGAHGWILFGRMYRKLAILLVSGQKDWETSVGRKLKFHCMFFCIFRKKTSFYFDCIHLFRKKYTEIS